MNDYRVNLDLYNGPLDLLLYLIRREELDIYDIPIARITEQYIQYVQLLQSMDPNIAGEFLLMAATLLEIKSRMLLPSPPPEEGGEAAGVGIDPRTELVRQLLEYKAFKDAAAELGSAAAGQALKFPRKPPADGDDQGQLDLEDAQVWDLFDAFSKLLTSIGQQIRQHEVIYDDTPQELHQADIIDRLQREGPITFRRIFEGRTSRSEIIGLFLALLELVRQKKTSAMQEAGFAEIYIALRPDTPSAPTPEAPPAEPQTAQAMPDEPAPAQAATPEEPPGEYVSEYPSAGPMPEEPNDEPDDDPETQGTGA